MGNGKGLGFKRENPPSRPHLALCGCVTWTRQAGNLSSPLCAGGNAGLTRFSAIPWRLPTGCPLLREALPTGSVLLVGFLCAELPRRGRCREPCLGWCQEQLALEDVCGDILGHLGGQGRKPGQLCRLVLVGLLGDGEGTAVQEKGREDSIVSQLLSRLHSCWSESRR